MTNTLHRYGNASSLRDDFLVFAIPSRGLNDDRVVEKQRRFLEVARQFHPVNIGDARHGGLYGSSRNLNPLVHWSRDNAPDFDHVLTSIDSSTTVAAVFDNAEAVVAFLQELRKEDLGLSINISADIEKARACAQAAGLERHSVEYSLGFTGQTDRMAERDVLELSTMCGHGMLSFAFVRKMIDWVRQGRRSPQVAAVTMARFCTCGVFNVSRACRLLNERIGDSGKTGIEEAAGSPAGSQENGRQNR